MCRFVLVVWIINAVSNFVFKKHLWCWIYMIESLKISNKLYWIHMAKNSFLVDYYLGFSTLPFLILNPCGISAFWNFLFCIGHFGLGIVINRFARECFVQKLQSLGWKINRFAMACYKSLHRELVCSEITIVWLKN